jgi:hypothetical protein
LATLPGERVERHRGEQLKGCHLPDVWLGRLHAPRSGSRRPRLGGESVVRKRLAVDREAFREAVQMRGGVEPNTVTRLDRGRGDEGAGRPFPFGPSDVNSGEIHMGIAQRRQ